MTKVLFVAFHGPAFGGKDTCCNLLEGMRKHPTPVLRPRFAEPIYDMIRRLVPGANSGMTKAEKELARAELGGLSVRQMAVAIGEGARRYNASCWINIWRDDLLDEAAEWINRGLDNKPLEHLLVLVPDLRRQDEREAFHLLPAQLLDRVAPRRQVEAAAVLVHLQARNAPVNEQFNAATETPLPYEERDLVLMNDHSAGLDALGATLAGTFALADHHAAHSLFLDMFRLDAWREAADALDAQPA